ncbi:hypothetical protein EsH8_IV_000077 [Colletotrichum jinshuiense]
MDEIKKQNTDGLYQEPATGSEALVNQQPQVQHSFLALSTMSTRYDNHQVSLQCILHVVGSFIGAEVGLCELYEAHRYDTTDDIGSISEVALFKLVGRDMAQKEKLKEFAAKETALSHRASFKNVIRYVDYLPRMRALVTERLPLRGGINPLECRFEDQVIVDIAWDILRGLAYLHGRGIVHGDIRCRNIIPGYFDSWKSRPCYKLFGHGLVPDVVNNLPKPDGYTAPELRRHNGQGGKGAPKPTFASDVWMLGMVLWQCHRYGSHWDAAEPPSRRGSSASRTLSQPDLTYPSHKGVNPLEVRARGCEPRPHQILQDLLRKMLVEDPRLRWGAMELVEEMSIVRYLGAEAAAVDEDLWELTAAVKTAKKEVWRMSRLGRLFGKVKRVLGGLVFVISLLFRIL